jgi:dTDP-4-amino-4,6-dideoxygalactose transaminase
VRRSEGAVTEAHARGRSPYDATVSHTIQSVPFLDLGAVHADIADSIADDISAVIESSKFVNGPQVADFESAFAEYCGTDQCVGLASGLDALRLALTALGLGPGAEVVVPAMTFVATWEAVSQVGAVPVPVDVSEEDYALDVAAVEAALGPRTAAVMPVHLYGQMADVDTLAALCERHSVPLIEDAAQAHGASRSGRRAGASGRASAFSFYPGKNLGAMGDAGALVTDDAALAARVRALREHGQYRKYEHDEIGWTARLDTIQAAVLARKLPLLDGWNAERSSIAALYEHALAGVGDLLLPSVPAGSEPVWHLYVIRTADPVALADHLTADGIGTGRHYPEPPHLSRAYASLGYSKGAFPVAEALASECLSLPIFPGMTESQALRVADSVVSWFGRG